MKFNFQKPNTNSFILTSNKIAFSLSLILLLSFSSSLLAQTVPADPTSVTATPSAVCAGGSSVVKAVSAGNTIKWYTVASGGSSIGTTASGAGFLVYPGAVTVYYAESWSPSNVPSAGRASVSITINVAPVITSTPSDVNTTNDAGQCGRIVLYPAIIATGTPTPTITYSNPSGSNFDIGTTTNITTATNTCGSSSLSFDVTVADNEQPTVFAPPAVTVNAPAGATTVSGVALGTPTANDNCGSVTVSNDAPAAFNGGSTTVIWTVTDSHGNSKSAAQTVTVVISNNPPSISSLTTSNATIAVNSSVTLTISWNDEAGGGPYTVEFDWKDGTALDVFSGLTGNSKSATHTYTASAVYEPVIKVTDGGGATTTTSYEYLPVYVTGNQFTTGGGNFIAPAGSYVANPSLSNKVTFGNNCKPKNTGGFTGSMEMNYAAANLKFKSTTPTNWDYLTVSNCYFAVFQGTGTINGSGNYGIVVSQTDKDRNPANANNIRIKIWNINAGNAVVFDSQMGADNNVLPITPVSNGAIQVHVQNNCIKLEDQDAQVYNNGSFETSVYPNPFSSALNISVSTPSASNMQIEIYDMVGKLIKSYSEVSPDNLFTVQNELPAGVYFVRVKQDENSQTVKVIKTNL